MSKKMDTAKELGKLLTEANMQVTFTGWKAELEILEKKVETLFDAIKHGDEKHQQWLKNKIEEHFK